MIWCNERQKEIDRKLVLTIADALRKVRAAECNDGEEFPVRYVSAVVNDESNEIEFTIEKRRPIAEKFICAVFPSGFVSVLEEYI